MITLLLALLLVVIASTAALPTRPALLVVLAATAEGAGDPQIWPSTWSRSA